VSRTSRLFIDAIRRAIEVGHRRCTHEYCDEPLSRCQADHIVPYSEGGPTVQENGRLLCGFRNRLRVKRPPPSPGDEPDDGPNDDSGD
jgi:5-methylcytosine-specific restriction endonuclease McrA